MDWYQGNNDKEKETPKGGVKRVGYVLWNYAGRLVGANVLFRFVLYSNRDDSGSSVSTEPLSFGDLPGRIWLFPWRITGKNLSLIFWKNLPAGVLTGALGFYSCYLLSLAGNFGKGTTHDVLIGCGIGVMIFAILIGGYYFVMSAMLDLGVGVLLKNTFLIMVLEWKLSMVIVITVVIAGGILLALAPYSLFLLLTIGVSFPQMVIYACVDRAVERRVLQPFEKLQSRRAGE